MIEGALTVIGRKSVLDIKDGFSFDKEECEKLRSRGTAAKMSAVGRLKQ